MQVPEDREFRKRNPASSASEDEYTHTADRYVEVAYENRMLGHRQKRRRPAGPADAQLNNSNQVTSEAWLPPEL